MSSTAGEACALPLPKPGCISPGRAVQGAAPGVATLCARHGCTPRAGIRLPQPRSGSAGGSSRGCDLACKVFAALGPCRLRSRSSAVLLGRVAQADIRYVSFKGLTVDEAARGLAIQLRWASRCSTA